MNSLRRSMGTVYSNIPSLQTFVDVLENWAPKANAESWDNVGLLTQPHVAKNVQTVMLTNDLTENVADEAVRKNVDLIISYHPPIFKGLLHITQRYWKERVISKLIENRIAIYSPHTSWDCSRDAVSDWLISPLVPESAQADVLENAGRSFTMEKPITLQELINRYKKLTQLDRIRVALGNNHDLASEISRVAVCAGSGASVLGKHFADVWITGEMSHHEILDAVHKPTTVLLLGHCNSERGFLSVFAKILREKFPNISVLLSEHDMDPVCTI